MALSEIWIDLPAGPPTYTAQQRRWTIRNGKPCTYPDSRAVKAKADMAALLKPWVPDTPIQGPVSLTVTLVWPYRKADHAAAAEGTMIPKITRPDADNLLKLLQDTMTTLGYWGDDAQITDLHVCKFWGPRPGIGINIE